MDNRREARLLQLVASGRLSSPQLLELWRDVNIALADKKAAEQHAIDAGDIGSSMFDPQSDHSRASARHAALYDALIAEAERLLAVGTGPSEYQGVPPGMTSEQERTIEYLAAIATNLVPGYGAPEITVGRFTRDGSLLVCLIQDPSARRVHTFWEIDQLGRHRQLWSKDQRRQLRQHGLDKAEKKVKVRRAWWTDIHGWRRHSDAD